MSSACYSLSLINLVIGVLTYLLFFGLSYFLNCNFHGLSGSITCDDLGFFTGLAHAVYGVVMLSFMSRFFTFFVLDMWGVAFFFNLIDKIGKNKKIEENEKTI